MDTTNISEWNNEVKNKAIHIVETFINKTKCQYEPLKSNISQEKTNINVHSSNYCDICERLIIGDREIVIHMNSHKHKRALKSKQRRGLLPKEDEKEEKFQE